MLETNVDVYLYVVCMFKYNTGACNQVDAGKTGTGSLNLLTWGQLVHKIININYRVFLLPTPARISIQHLLVSFFQSFLTLDPVSTLTFPSLIFIY